MRSIAEGMNGAQRSGEIVRIPVNLVSYMDNEECRNVRINKPFYTNVVRSRSQTRRCFIPKSTANSPGCICSRKVQEDEAGPYNAPVIEEYMSAPQVNAESTDSLLEDEDDQNDPNMHDYNNLMDFVRLCSPQTNDNGKVILEVMNDELQSFRKFVEEVFEMQTQDIGKILAKEQSCLKDRYEQWLRTMQQRKHRVQEALTNLMPEFDWYEYKKDDYYLHNYFLEKIPLTENSKDVKPKEDLAKLRQQMFYRMIFVEEELTKLQENEEELLRTLNELRKDKHNRQSQQAAEERYLQQKNVRLQKKIKHLHEKRKKLKDYIENVYLEQHTD